MGKIRDNKQISNLKGCIGKILIHHGRFNLKQPVSFLRKSSQIDAQGQSLVEFALLIPLLVLIVFGAVDLARAFHAQVTITNASREGARFAMRINKDGTYPTTLDKETAIKQRTVDEAGISGVTMSTDDVTVLCGGVAYYSPCPSGTELEVIVDYEFTLSMGAYFIPSFPLSHATQMVTP
jgi:Flp pilus assembly protein TadG